MQQHRYVVDHNLGRSDKHSIIIYFFFYQKYIYCIWEYTAREMLDVETYFCLCIFWDISNTINPWPGRKTLANSPDSKASIKLMIHKKRKQGCIQKHRPTTLSLFIQWTMKTP